MVLDSYEFKGYILPFYHKRILIRVGGYMEFIRDIINIMYCVTLTMYLSTICRNKK